MYRCEPGWFFYCFDVFALPRGYYICGEEPVYLRKLAKFGRILRFEDTKYHRLPRALVEACAKQTHMPNVGQATADHIQRFMNHPRYFNIMAYHAQSVKMNEFLFIKLFITQMLPNMSQFDNFWKILQLIEIFGYRVQRVLLRQYIGPAPPSYLLDRIGIVGSEPKAFRKISLKNKLNAGKSIKSNSSRVIRKQRPPVSPLFRDQKDNKQKKVEYKKPPYFMQNISLASGPGSSITRLDKEPVEPWASKDSESRYSPISKVYSSSSLASSQPDEDVFWKAHQSRPSLVSVPESSSDYSTAGKQSLRPHRHVDIEEPVSSAIRGRSRSARDASRSWKKKDAFFCFRVCRTHFGIFSLPHT